MEVANPFTKQREGGTWSVWNYSIQEMPSHLLAMPVGALLSTVLPQPDKWWQFVGY